MKDKSKEILWVGEKQTDVYNQICAIAVIKRSSWKIYLNSICLYTYDFYLCEYNCLLEILPQTE